MNYFSVKYLKNLPWTYLTLYLKQISKLILIDPTWYKHFVLNDKLYVEVMS